MRIIISPAKKMNVENGVFCARQLPCFLAKTQILMEHIKSLTYEEAKKLWGCSDKLAELNYQRFQEMNLERNLTPAILSYEGIQYQHMAPGAFTQDAWDYVQEHLRILSGFYGILKPFDGVVPYRLEMQAKLKTEKKKDLYEFWGESLYSQLTGESRTIINLASKEYSKCIEAYLTAEDRFVTCIFGEEKEGKILQKGTQAKIARGEMVRFMAETQAEKMEDLKSFHSRNYCFREDLSSDKEYVFVQDL